MPVLASSSLTLTSLSCADSRSGAITVSFGLKAVSFAFSAEELALANCSSSLMYSKNLFAFSKLLIAFFAFRAAAPVDSVSNTRRSEMIFDVFVWQL